MREIENKQRAVCAMAGVTSSTTSPEEELTLTVKWSGKEYTVRLCGDDTVGELKRRICQLTTVLPKRQKLLYPKLLPSKLADDAVLLSSLPFKSSIKMTMIGSVPLFLTWFSCLCYWLMFAHQVFDKMFSYLCYYHKFAHQVFDKMFLLN